jgi:hypothetical protein
VSREVKRHQIANRWWQGPAQQAFGYPALGPWMASPAGKQLGYDAKRYDNLVEDN